MIFQGVQFEVPHIALLTPSDISSWARKSVWYWREAVMLSIGCSPVVTNQEQTLSADQSTEWGTKLQNRADETERAMMARELLFTRVQYSLEDETTFPAFRPLDFVNWLYKSKLPHPKELFEAVQRQHSGEVSDVREPARLCISQKRAGMGG